MLRDRAIRGILAANAVTLIVALWQQWPATLLLWPYWIQSVVIGWYARRRILALQRFSTEGFRINDRAVEPTEATKRETANFFAFHYGFFHVGYLVFMLVLSFGSAFGGAPSVNDWWLFGLLGIAFWHTHRSSHLQHLAADIRHERNIGALMFLPYARIFPMHITIILGTLLGGSSAAVLLFIVLKTGADVLMHVVEHRWLQRAPVARSRPSSQEDRGA
jgi:hypothetical protein